MKNSVIPWFLTAGLNHIMKTLTIYKKSAKKTHKQLECVVAVTVTYIRVTRNSNEIPLLNSNNTVGYLTQVNEGNSISFIYTIGFYRCFGIHSVISLLLS